MALIVETGQSITNANSYITLADNKILGDGGGKAIVSQ